MHDTTKTLLVSTAMLASTIIAGCGGGGGGSSTPPPVADTPAPPPPPTGDSFALDGTASKGLILGGAVTVTDLAGAVLATGQTSATDGRYTLSIPDTANFEGDIVLVTVTGGPGATMICDAGEGCGDVAFGDPIAIGADVRLRALAASPGDGGSANLNLNVLGELATAAVLSASTSPTAAQVASAKQSVMDTFGLIATDPLTLSPSGKDADSVRLSLLSGGVLGAIYDNGLTIGGGLIALGNDFTGRGNELLIRQAVPSPTITYEEILRASVATATASADAQSSDVRRAAVARLLIEAQQARAAESNRTTRSTPASGADDAPLDQAKAFVNDLQTVIAAVESETNADELDGFIDRLEIAGDLLEDDVSAAAESVSTIVDRVSDIYESGARDDGDTGFDDGLVISATYAGERGTYTIDQTYEGFATDLIFVLDYDLEETREETETSSRDTTDITGTVSVSGRVENAAIVFEIDPDSMLRIDNGSSVIIDDVSTTPNDITTFFDEATLRADRVALDLSARIRTVDNSLSLEGLLSGDLVSPFDQDTGRFIDAFADIRQDENRQGFEALDLAFSGTAGFEGKTVDISLGAFTQGTGLDLTAGNVRVVDGFLRYDVESPTRLRRRFAFSNDNAYELISQATAEAEIDAITVTPTMTSSGGFSRYELADGSVVFTLPFAEGEQVFKTQTFAGSTDDVRETVYVSTSDVDQVFFGADTTVSPVPTRIADFANDVLGFGGTGFFSCVDGNAVNGQASVYFRPDITVTPEGGEVLTYEVGTFNTCGDFFDFGFDSFFNPDAVTTLDPALSLSTLYAASISQDIIGIDADDPRVRLSAFGPAEISAGDVSGSITFELDYAGRRFRTNARAFDIFEDLSIPVTVTNRNDIVLTISEASDGTVAGNITKDEEVLGTLRDTGDIVFVDFTDGTFVSLR